MFKKKIFKVLSLTIAIAVFIACFVIPCSAVSFGEDFIINYYSLVYSVYDDNGEYVETIYSEPDSVIVTFDENKFCFDISSVPSVSNGYYFIDIDFDFSYPVSSDSSEAVIFYYPQGLGAHVNCNYDYEDLNGNLKTSYFFDCSDYNALGFICTPDALYYNCNLRFLSKVQTDNFSFVVEVASDVDNIDEYLSSSGGVSGGSPDVPSVPDSPELPLLNTLNSFLIDIGIFVSSCFSWIKELLNIIVVKPALFILSIGVVVCGFAVGLLSRIKRG